ncbi:MAG: epoxyqueuosine reductase QueH [Candidatus Helarchaeota archaeon]
MKLLLDCCCGPCATHCINELQKDYDITLFVSNFNIHPKEEYEKRLQSLKKYAEIKKIPLINLEYNPNNWFNAIKGHEGDKEGGERCKICFAFRLELAAKWGKENNFDLFTTTLTISPHKNAQIINSIGIKISKKYNIKFLEANFKKMDGFKKSIAISKKYNLYRQSYCGCLFSIRKKWK